MARPKKYDRDFVGRVYKEFLEETQPTRQKRAELFKRWGISECTFYRLVKEYKLTAKVDVVVDVN